MRALVLAALLLACSTPAAAQVRSVTDLVIVDANDRVVGQVVNLASQPGSPLAWPEHSPVVMLRRGAHIAILYAYPYGLGGDDSVLFKTTDCTGQPFVRFQLSHNPFVFLQPSAMFAWGVYQARPGGEGRTVTIRSVGHAEGSCRPPFFPISDEPDEEFAYPARRVMDLTGLWTPPFRIR